VNLIQQKAESIIKEYRKVAESYGLSVSTITKAAYNYESVVSDGKDKVKLQVYFGKKGNKVVLQGNKELDLYKKLRELVFGEDLFSNGTTEIKEPEIYIGTDESGKGDYFGPLIIAGVFVNGETIRKLRIAGVRDSKDLNETAIRKTAAEIKKIISEAYNIITITPEKYNELYLNFKNVNKLLGWGHAKVLENILEKFPAAEAISDKFGNERYIKDSLQKEGKNLNLVQVTKAERFTAVAAASILARDKFNEWFEKKNKELKVQLPKGASSAVEQKAVELKNMFGREFLLNLVKLHFKTSKKINL
jgi:ribonuclease HIII